MSPEKLRIREYEELLRFETLLTDLSARFVNLSADQVDAEIESALKQVCDHLHLDIATFWEWEAYGSDVLLLTHFYRPLGGEPVPERMTATEYFPWCWGLLLQQKVIILSNVEDAPAEAAGDLAVWRHYGIKSDLSFPLAAGGGKTQGVVAFCTTQAERIWTETLVKRLGLVAQVFSNAIVRKQTELALRESETRLRLAADAAEAGLWGLDFTTKQFWLTDMARKQFQFTSEEVVTLDKILEIAHPDDRDKIRQKIQEVVSTGQDGEVLYRIRRKNGDIRWMQSVGRVQTNPSNNLTLMGVTFDITERIHAEEEARHQRETLAHISRVTTLGELSGALAHEINQPLAIIMSNAQAAQRLIKQVPPDLVEIGHILSDIVAEDRRAGEVIRHMRELLKRGETTMVPLAMNAVVEEVIDMMHADIISRRVTVELALSPELPRIRGDRIQLQQVILNVVFNAFDALADNETTHRRVRISSMRHQDVVRLSVSDEGHGLPDDVEALFQPFVTTKSKGLGVGLAISRSIVRAHAGRLWAEANPTGGAIFHLDIPLATKGAAS
jgi:PAS domain S-box-containing protein